MGVVHGSKVVMPITLGTNIAALNAQRRLGNSSQELSTVFERLSSGQRINRASDDAAGLAIADSLNADSRVYAQGIRNVNDGLSLLNIADSAIDNLSTIVARLSELAEQSANGVYSHVQRQALDAEGQTLSDEYFRIIQSTEFNGRKLFDAEFGELRLQAGYGLDGSVYSDLGGNIGNGSFGEVSVSNFYGSGITYRDITYGDFNGDGHLDFAGVSDLSGVLNISLGDGNGNFQGDLGISGTQTPISNSPRFVEAADFNSDGVLDLVVATSSNNSLNILIGNGDGTFQSAVTYTGGPGNRKTAIGDINNDGILDLVTGDSTSNSVTALLGNGDGTFATGVSYTVLTVPDPVELADFNGDGALDIVVGNTGNSKFSILLNNGDGTFQAQTTYTSADAIWNIAVTDFNGDGIEDIVSVGSAAAVSIHIGNGDGTFQAMISLALPGGTVATDVQTADMNGDGNADIVVASYGTGINVLHGNGDGTFGAVVSSISIGGARSVVTADFNEDGVYDALTARTGFYVLTQDTVSGVSPLLEFDLSTISGSRQALTDFKNKIDQLSEQRGKIGSFMARLQTASSNLLVASENFRAAESRIRDADIAQESSQLVRLNILQQASAAVLAQANQQPALALQLLGNRSG